MVKAIDGGLVPGPRSKEVFAAMLAKNCDVDTATKELGIEQVDESELVALCQELVDANPKIVADVKAGKMQAIGALIGQAKGRNPNVDPGRVREICLELAQKA